MAPPLPTVAKLKLSYPLYGADFDPLNNSFLIVGGGGGEGKHGVGNKISLLDTSRRAEISELVEIDLSKDEDSVTSLAVLGSTDDSVTAYAGVNSSEADQKAGHNEHFRSLKIAHPRLKSGSHEASSEKDAPTQGTSQTLARASFFKPTSAKLKETYQRITRLSSPQQGAPDRVVAVATGLASESEIVVLNATPAPQRNDEVARIALGSHEAADVDFGSINETPDWLLAFCTDTEVFTQRISHDQSGAKEEANLIYEPPALESSARGSGKSKFRSLRYLTHCHILLSRNLPQRSGVELLVLKLGDSGSIGRVVLQKQLSSATKAAVGMDVCRLSSSPTGEYQLIVAVASQGGSIELLSLEYSPIKGLATFKPHVSLKNVHAASITNLVFSKFLPPSMPVTKDTPAQIVKLASVSVGQTVVVHTFPLQPYLATKSRTPRYVLASPGSSDAVQATFSVLMATIVIAIAAILLQAFAEIRGAAPPTLGAADWLSPGIKHWIHQPYISGQSPTIPSDIPVVSAVKPKLEDLVAEHAPAETKRLL